MYARMITETELDALDALEDEGTPLDAFTEELGADVLALLDAYEVELLEHGHL